MGDRTILGTADVPDERLLAYAATALALDVADCGLVHSRAEVVDYDLDAITTGGRWWVTADLSTPDGPAFVRFFVKLVQSWSRSPYFAFVPPEMRELAERGVPWRTEPLVYASDLGERLPDGLTMAGVVDVRPVDDLSTVIWLREVDVVVSEWPVTELGPRLACSAGWLRALRSGRSPRSARPTVAAASGRTPRACVTRAAGFPSTWSAAHTPCRC